MLVVEIRAGFAMVLVNIFSQKSDQDGWSPAMLTQTPRH